MYDMLCRIADGDYLKLQQLWEQPIKGVLNHLSYLLSGGYKHNSK